MMNLSLLQTLRAMKHVEDHPLCKGFKTRNIDLATFIPMYPNVVVVDQRESRVCDDRPFIPATTRLTSISADSPVKYEFISNSISRALSTVR